MFIHCNIRSSIIVSIILILTTANIDLKVDHHPINFLKEQRLSKFWPQFEALGIVHVEDYLLVLDEDLDDFGFKTVHKRKFHAAIKKLQNKQSSSNFHPDASDPTLSNPSLSHATLLMTTKLRKMKMKTLRSKLIQGDPSISSSNYRSEVQQLSEAIDALHQLASKFDMSEIFQEATMEDLEEAHEKGQLLEYLTELEDLQNLKQTLTGILDNPNILDVSALRDPVILQEILNDQEERDRKQRERERIRNKQKNQKTCAPTADWQSCASYGAAGVSKDLEVNSGSGSSGGNVDKNREKKKTKFYSFQKFNDNTDLDQKLRKGEAHFQLAHMLHQEGQLDAAIEEYTRCLEITPMHVTAKHMLAVVNSAKQKDSILYDRAENGYIEMLFDSYASTYDEHMVDKLLYQVPHLISDELTKQFTTINQPRPFRVLDLGCGTGLIGKLWRKQNENNNINENDGNDDENAYFVGIDMSSNMLDIAANIYTRVIHSTIDEYFDVLGDGSESDNESESEPVASYDAVTIGDVFGYVGDIRSILQGASTVMLSSTSRLIFTIEASSERLSQGWRLDVKTSRFIHDVEYVKNLLENIGLIVVEEKKVTLRYQLRMPVKGVLFVCLKR